MWFYNNREIDTLPEDCMGFVYLITNLSDNRKYVGKKLAKFTRTRKKTVTLKNGKKKQKKVKVRKDSDWKEYYGSSKELNKDIESLGTERFKREILFFCKSKAECSYVEAREQFSRKVLESTDYYNGNIMIRVHGSHILGKL